MINIVSTTVIIGSSMPVIVGQRTFPAAEAPGIAKQAAKGAAVVVFRLCQMCPI